MTRICGVYSVAEGTRSTLRQRLDGPALYTLHLTRDRKELANFQPDVSRFCFEAEEGLRRAVTRID